MKIGVSGASGELGKIIVAELRARGAGNQIIGISRTPDALPEYVERRHGDYDKPETLAHAYAGLDRLVLIPSAETGPGVRRTQNIRAIDAAVQAGVKHILLLSSVGTRDMADPHVYATYFASEQRLMRTAPSWTILRMNYYTEMLVKEAQGSLASGFPMTGLGENRVAYVSREDVGATAAGVLLTEGHAGAIYNATGPKSLSGAERAGIISEVAGKSVAYAAITEDQLRAGLQGAGLPADVINAVVSIRQSFADGGFDIVTRDVEKLAGRPPRSVGDVLSKAFAAR